MSGSDQARPAGGELSPATGAARVHSATGRCATPIGETHGPGSGGATGVHACDGAPLRGQLPRHLRRFSTPTECPPSRESRATRPDPRMVGGGGRHPTRRRHHRSRPAAEPGSPTDQRSAGAEADPSGAQRGGGWSRANGNLPRWGRRQVGSSAPCWRPVTCTCWIGTGSRAMPVWANCSGRPMTWSLSAGPNSRPRTRDTRSAWSSRSCTSSSTRPRPAWWRWLRKGSTFWGSMSISCAPRTRASSSPIYGQASRP